MHWQNLNGHWDYAITPVEQKTIPDEVGGKDSCSLSAWNRNWVASQRLLDATRSPLVSTHVRGDHGERLSGSLLNFEAVDYRCEVFVNGKSVGKHQGGNTPFSFDITDAIERR